MSVSLGSNRCYCFTAWSRPVFNESVMKYMIYGEELCPETKKLHYQGYVELSSPARVVACKKYFKDNTIHLEKRKGSRQQAIDYCKKDGKFEEFAPDLSLVLPRSDVTGCNKCNDCGKVTGQLTFCLCEKCFLRHAHLAIP